MTEELHDLNAEQLLLWMLLNHENRHEIIHQVFPSLFHSSEFRNIYNVIKELGESVDIFGVCRVVERKHGVPYPSTALLFTSVDDYSALRTNPQTLINHLKDLLYRRTVVAKTQKIAAIARRGLKEDASLISSELDKIPLIEKSLLRSGQTTVSRLSKMVADAINTDDDVIVTGHAHINSRMYGLTKKCLSGLLAQPGHLKSTYTDHLISSTVELHGYRGLIISLEDPKEDRVKRIISSRLGISLTSIRFKKVKVEEKDVSHVLKDIMRSNLFVLDSNDVLTPDNAYSAILDIRPDIVVIDHIQEFEMDDMVIGIIRAIRKLKTAAMRCNCHILITSQVADKQFKQRVDKKPKADDAQWTSALRQSSSEMFSLYYPFQDNNNPYVSHILNFSVLKCRYAIAVGSFDLVIDADKGLIKGEAIKLNGESHEQH